MALMNDTLLETSAVFVSPVGSESGRSPSTLSIGQAVRPGGLAPGQRWSVGRKRDVVLRLLRGESTESLSRELGVPSYRLERWRERALSGIDGSLREREGDAGSEELAAAMKRIGELTMENEVLRARVGLFIELARNDTRLVILQPQTMQERDQSRAAFINEPEFLLDPGADLTGRTRQCSGYPRLQIALLLYTQIACAPAHIEAGDAFDPALLEELAPAPDRVVIKEQRIGDLLTAPPFVQKHQGIRTPRYPARRRPVARQRRKRLAIFIAEEARLNHSRNRIRPIGKCKKFLSGGFCCGHD